MRRPHSPSQCGPGCHCQPGPAGRPGSGRPGHACGGRDGTCWQACLRESCSGPRPSPRCSCSGSGWSAGLQRRWMTVATLESANSKTLSALFRNQQQQRKITEYTIDLGVKSSMPPVRVTPHSYTDRLVIPLTSLHSALLGFVGQAFSTLRQEPPQQRL